MVPLREGKHKLNQCAVRVVYLEPKKRGTGVRLSEKLFHVTLRVRCALAQKRGEAPFLSKGGHSWKFRVSLGRKIDMHTNW